MQQRIRYKIGSIADTVLFVTAIEDFNKSLHYIVELGTLITGRYPLASHIVCSNSVKLSPLLSASTSLPIFTNLSNHILTNLATRQVLSKLLPRVMSYTSTGVHSLQFCTLHSSTSLGAAELLWSLSGLLYGTDSVSWHVDYHFKVKKKKDNSWGKKTEITNPG